MKASHCIHQGSGKTFSTLVSARVHLGDLIRVHADAGDSAIALVDLVTHTPAFASNDLQSLIIQALIALKTPAAL